MKLDEEPFCLCRTTWGAQPALIAGDHLGYLHIVDEMCHSLCDPLDISIEPVQSIVALDESVFCAAFSGGDEGAGIVVIDGSRQRELRRIDAPFSIVAMDAFIGTRRKYLVTLGFMGEVGIVDPFSSDGVRQVLKSPHEHGLPGAVACSSATGVAITVGGEGNLATWSVEDLVR